MGILTKAAPTQVDVKHIPYVETLWTRLEAARQAQSDKEAYIVAARQLGVQTASLRGVTDNTIADGRVVSESARTLECIKRLLAFGAEPATPPATWFCGWVEEPKKVFDARDQVKDYPRETWPCRDNSPVFGSWRTTRCLVFKGAMPIQAMQKYAATKGLVSETRVYSPNEDDFKVLRAARPIDPVLYGMVEFLGKREYFEIARWDVDKDLASIFSKTGG